MSTTYTPSIKLGEPALGDTGWGATLNANAAALDALAPLGGLAVTTHEQPSSTLHVDVAAGTFVDQSGAVQTYAGVSNQAITLSTTKTLYLDGAAAWALVVGSSYPATPHVRLATVTAGATTITSITDNRQSRAAAGSIAEGTVWTLGTATGLKIGSGSTEKLGFYGATPVVRPTMGAATAGGTYTSAEAAMINALWSALRNLGLGS